MSEPEAFFEQGFAEGGGQLHTRDGDVWELPVRQWTADAGPGDAPLLSRCRGATLDVGCGPGRMVAALTARGVTALGIDVSPMAVAMTRSRGGPALHRDVFSLAHGPRLWRHVLLVDGNVGIGGDPVRLLWLCRELLTAGGSILVDVAPPGQGLQVTTARLVGRVATGDWFAWATLGTDALEVVAAAAGLAVAEVWRADPGPLDPCPMDAGPLDMGPLDAGPLDAGLLGVGPLDPGGPNLGNAERWQAELVPAGTWPAPRLGGR